MLSKFKTSTKLFVLTVISSLILIVFGAHAFIELTSMESEFEQGLNDTRNENAALIALTSAETHFKTQMQEWKNILIRGNVSEEFDKHLNGYGEQYQATQQNLATAIVLLQKRNLPVADIEQLKQKHAELDKTFRAALSGFNRDDPNAGKSIDHQVRGLDRPLSEGVEKIVKEIQKRSDQSIQEFIARERSSSDTTKKTFLANIAIGLFFSIILAIAILRDLLQQLGGEPAYAAEIARRIAAGDLTGNITVEAKHANSLMAAMKEMQDQLKTLIIKINDSASHVTSSTEQLASVSKQVSTSSDQQSEATSSVAAAVEQLTVSIDQVAHNASEAEQKASDSGSQADQGTAQVKNATDEMSRIAQAVNETAGQMTNLSEQAQQIGSIAGVIKDVADQTNLLALNAAIEAARAGEQGRGFAVVADEVRKLAERTTTSAQEITSMISSIQELTNAATLSMQRENERVANGVVLAERAVGSMQLISASSGEVVQAVSDISSALNEQKIASSEIARHIEHIAQMTEQNSHAVSEVAAAANKLESLALDLKQSVSGFRV